REALEELRQAYGRSPRVVPLERDVTSRPASWRRARTLYLSTTFLHEESPLRSPELAAPLPLYLLPLAPSLREQIMFWSENYRHHDALWIGSGKLEIPAYRQLADPRSELSQQGRGLCRRIESATRKPTYYYLRRYYGRARGEERRRCPGCGRKWAVAAPRAVWSFAAFPFRCARCRLVSHPGDDLGGGRWTSIGELPRSRPAGPRRR